MLHRSRVNLHSPCSGAVGVPTRRRSAPPPIAGAAPERYAGGPVGAPTPDSNRQCAAPTPPASQHRPHQPKCAPNGGSGPGVVAAPALPHPGLGYRRGAPSQPAADPGYPHDMSFAAPHFLASVVTQRPPFSVVFTDWLSITAPLVLQRRFLDLVSFWAEIAPQNARAQSCQACGLIAMRMCSRVLSCEPSL